MCWSLEASAGIVVAGAAATAVTFRRGEPAAIWGTLAYFTLMEALQVAGYLVIDDCGTPANRSVTFLSYLHIVFQPFFVNWFAMELVPSPVKARVRKWAFGICAISAAIMLAQVLPLAAFGRCIPGTPLCGEAWCTVSGNWHIAWDVPYNGLLVPLENLLGTGAGFPSYMIASFIVPLAYGAWRFVLVNLLMGPVLASLLTDNPNEMPAVWCLFSIAIICIGLSPLVRRSVETRNWWGREVGATGD